MLFKQKLIVLLLTTLFFGGMIVLIIGVVGLVLDGFNSFTMGFTLGGVLLYAILFLYSNYLKKKFNARNTPDKVNSGTDELSSLQKLMQTKPRTFVIKAWFMSALGSFYVFILFAINIIFAVLAIIIFNELNMPWLALIISSVSILTMAFSTGWTMMHTYRTDGITLPRVYFQDLYQKLDALFAKTRSPKLSAVIITEGGQCEVFYNDVNLFYKIIELHLDIRLLLCLTEDELCILIENEMWKLSLSSQYKKLHHRQYLWGSIWRMAYSKGKISRLLVAKFSRWYTMKLGNYCTILGKEAALKADEKHVASQRSNLANALCKRDFIIEKFHANAYVLPLSYFEDESLSDNYYQLFRHVFHEKYAIDSVRWINERLNWEVDEDSLFLSLSERVKRLETPDINLIFQESENNAFDNLLEYILGIKRISLEDFWLRRHREWLEALEQTICDPETDPELYNQAVAFLSLDQNEEAKGVLDKLCETTEPYVPALIKRGTIKFEQGDHSGLNDLKRAIEIDPSNAEDVFMSINPLRWDYPDLFWDEEIEWLESAEAEYEKRSAEINTVSSDEVFFPSEIDQQSLNEILSALKKHANITKALLVKRKISFKPYWQYILAIAYGQFVGQQVMNNTVFDICRSLTQSADTILFVNLNANPLFWKPLALIPDSLIFERRNRNG